MQLGSLGSLHSHGDCRTDRQAHSKTSVYITIHPTRKQSCDHVQKSVRNKDGNHTIECPKWLCVCVTTKIRQRTDGYGYKRFHSSTAYVRTQISTASQCLQTAHTNSSSSSLLKVKDVAIATPNSTINNSQTFIPYSGGCAALLLCLLLALLQC